MSLLVKAGITKLSELIIDADKDWGSYGISNLKELAAAMAHGDIGFRGASILEGLIASAPGKYLQTLGPGFPPIWSDVLGATPIRIVTLPTLTIPTPSISQVTEQHSSPPGRTATPSLTIPLPTIGDAAEVSSLVIEDCEAAWDEYVQANVTSTADGVTKKIGAASAKMAVADAAAVGRLATHDIGPFDLTSYRYLRAWVYCSIALSSGDISILLDNHAQCVSPEKDLGIGDIPATTWTQITLDMGDTSGLGAVISIGADMDIDKGIFDIWFDQVRATKGGG